MFSLLPPRACGVAEVDQRSCVGGDVEVAHEGCSIIATGDTATCSADWESARDVRAQTSAAILFVVKSASESSAALGPRRRLFRRHVGAGRRHGVDVAGLLRYCLLDSGNIA